MPRGRHILVTGAAGFIGSHLVEDLLREGYHVTGVDNFDPFYDRAIKATNIAHASQSPRFRLHELDIRDSRRIFEMTGEYDAIVHLGAKAGVRPSIEDPLSYYDTNVRGTQNLLELARRQHVPHFVFASSSSVYGVNPNLPWREDDAVLLPISPYASTKVSGELIGHVYSHLYGMRFVALRFFTVYGPRQRPDLAIHKFAKLIWQREPVPVYGDGSGSRDYTYIADIIRGIRAALDYENTAYEVINLGNERPIALIDLIRALETSLGIPAKLVMLPMQPGDVPHTWADISKARTLLKYCPITELSAGLAPFVEWFTKDLTQARHRTAGAR